MDATIKKCAVAARDLGKPYFFIQFHRELNGTIPLVTRHKMKVL